MTFQEKFHNVDMKQFEKLFVGPVEQFCNITNDQNPLQETMTIFDQLQNEMEVVKCVTPANEDSYEEFYQSIIGYLNSTLGVIVQKCWPYEVQQIVEGRLIAKARDHGYYPEYWRPHRYEKIPAENNITISNELVEYLWESYGIGQYYQQVSFQKKALHFVWSRFSKYLQEKDSDMVLLLNQLVYYHDYTKYAIVCAMGYAFCRVQKHPYYFEVWRNNCKVRHAMMEPHHLRFWGKNSKDNDYRLNLWINRVPCVNEDHRQQLRYLVEKVHNIKLPTAAAAGSVVETLLRPVHKAFLYEMMLEQMAREWEINRNRNPHIEDWDLFSVSYQLYHGGGNAIVADEIRALGERLKSEVMWRAFESISLKD